MKNLIIELTNACNLDCKMCPRQYVNMKEGFMDERLWMRLVHEVSTDVTIIPFWRGESTLHPYFTDFLRYAAKRLPNIIIATNGIVDMTQVFPVDLLFDIKEISVSIHNEQSLRGLDALLKMRGSGSKPRIQASSVEGCDIPDYKIAAVKPDNIRIYQQHTIHGMFGKINYSPLIARHACSKLSTDLVISWDGYISRCTHVWEPIDLNIKDISLVEAEQIMRESSIVEEYPDEICSQCDQWSNEHTL